VANAIGVGARQQSRILQAIQDRRCRYMRIWSYLNDGSNYSGAACLFLTSPRPESPRQRRARTFEKVFLNASLSDEMMKTAGSSAFCASKQADMWRSFMSEAVAGPVVEQRGCGSRGSVSQMLDATVRVKSTVEGAGRMMSRTFALGQRGSTQRGRRRDQPL